jgi:AcrR family transcriptional regulator
MRADARRNYDRVLAAALDAVAEHGVDTSLDDIARRAGVGSGTLYRHFPTRQALLEAVFRDRIIAQCVGVPELIERVGPAEALSSWLREFVDYLSVQRGLSAVLMTGLTDGGQFMAQCHDQLRSAVSELLARAQEVGAVRPDVQVTELLKLANAVALATEGAPDASAQADRLISLVLDGVRRNG